MVEHVIEWLGAYLDGELHGSRLHQVEDHLEICPACRSELESLRSLSDLLHESAPEAALASSEKFVARLTLSLPRRAAAEPGRKALEVGWWLIPVGLLGAWVFLQTLLMVSTLTSAAAQFGVLAKAAPWLQEGVRHTDWFTASMSLFGNRLNESGRMTLDLLDQVAVFGRNIVVQIAGLVAIALLYWAWLVSWWIRRGRRKQGIAIPRLPQTPV